MCLLAAGAWATENWGGAGEHPRVCEDEGQPAQDQAGDRWRGADHLKNKPQRVSGWLCACLWARRRQECLYRRKSVCGGELPGFPNKLFLPLARRETLQSKDHPSVRLPPTASTRLCSSHPSSSTQHPLQEGPNTDRLYTFSVVESFQRALMEKRTNVHTGVTTPTPSLFSLLSPQQAIVSLHFLSLLLWLFCFFVVLVLTFRIK